MLIVIAGAFEVALVAEHNAEVVHRDGIGLVGAVEGMLECERTSKQRFGVNVARPA